MKKLIRGATFAAAMLSAGAAFAAPALVTTNLNLRAGPSTGYAPVATLPDGAIVDVAGCTRGYGWCRVRWHGYDGWAAASYLAQQEGGRVYSNAGADIGVPLIAGAVIGGALLAGHHHHYDHYRGGWRGGHHGGWRGHHGGYSGHSGWRGGHHWRHH